MKHEGSDTFGFETGPLTLRMGLEVRDADVRMATDQDILALAALLLKHVVLVIRRQNISSREHVAFASRFGRLEVFPPHTDDAKTGLGRATYFP